MEDDSGESMEPMEEQGPLVRIEEIQCVPAWLTERSRELIPETRGGVLSDKDGDQSRMFNSTQLNSTSMYGRRC